MEKPRHVFTEMNLVLELIQESQVKSKSPRKKKEYIFCNTHFGNLFRICVLS